MKKQLLSFFIFIIACIFPVVLKAQSSRGCVVTYMQVVNICHGDSLSIGTHTYYTPSTYYDTLSAAGGCDSILTTHLNIAAPIHGAQSFAICHGESITVGVHVYTTAGFYYDTLTSFRGCDSTVNTYINFRSPVTVTQSPIICGTATFTVGINTYNVAGTYRDTLHTFRGCDSIIITELHVNEPIFAWQNSYICSGGSLTIGTHTYTTGGFYTDTLIAFAGCDSIIETSLNVLWDSGLQVEPNMTTCGCGGIYGSIVLYYSGTAHYQWVDCNNNMAPIPGDTTMEILPPSMYTIYSYAVVISDHGCVDTSDCADVVITGINELNAAENQLSVYPSPATDLINLEFYTTTGQPLSISITDVLGASVYELHQTYSSGVNTLAIPVNNISNGVYTVKISDRKNTMTKRIVISR